jgi:hypothetical protein
MSQSKQAEFRHPDSTSLSTDYLEQDNKENFTEQLGS